MRGTDSIQILVSFDFLGIYAWQYRAKSMIGQPLVALRYAHTQGLGIAISATVWGNWIRPCILVFFSHHTVCIWIKLCSSSSSTMSFNYSSNIVIYFFPIYSLAPAFKTACVIIKYKIRLPLDKWDGLRGSREKHLILHKCTSQKNPTSQIS